MKSDYKKQKKGTPSLKERQPLASPNSTYSRTVENLFSYPENGEIKSSILHGNFEHP